MDGCSLPACAWNDETPRQGPSQGTSDTQSTYSSGPASNHRPDTAVTYTGTRTQGTTFLSHHTYDIRAQQFITTRDHLQLTSAMN
jgi:hypothetical protein